MQAQEAVSSKPSLLLTEQRLKRLKRDRDRQTERWMNFEARVQNVPNSTERGFELALYYKITGDERAGTEAASWAKAHPCERRQVAFIRSVFPTAAKPASGSSCAVAADKPLAEMRDAVFGNQADSGYELKPEAFLAALQSTPLDDAGELYAAAEILSAMGREWRETVQEKDAPFFNSLPVQFLLTLKPSQVEHPDWMTHVAGLALVALNPNNDSSQFLQGWAMSDRQMLREGPGVAYELLWADPYLPSVGYQNLDPWWYDEEHARLLARTDWSPDACAVSIGKRIRAEHCPQDWQSQTIGFGKLQLIPFVDRCVQIPERPNNSPVIVWRLPAMARLKADQAHQSMTLRADQAGLWRVPSNIAGKVCIVKER